MITIHESPTADTRSCDYTQVSKEQLLQSSAEHIGDVSRGLAMFATLLEDAGERHDYDKIELIDGFHEEFKGGFKTDAWLKNHYRVNRHHLAADGGLPSDVNLVDVLEYIVDCVMAGMARSGHVRKLEIPSALLQKAFRNTVNLMHENVEVAE